MLAAPVSQHDYLYANGSPTNATDPSGYFTLAELQAGGLIRNTLHAVGLQFGAGLLIRGLAGGGQIWDGPTISANFGKFNATGGFFTTIPDATKTMTSVMMLAYGEQLKAPNLFADKLQSFVGKKIPKGVGGQEMILQILLLESLTFLNQLNLDVTISTNTMNTPAFFGTGAGASAGFLGAYASAGVGVSTGLPGFAAAWSLLGSTGKNAIGVSGVIAGYSFGISVPDIGLSTSGSAGPSFVIGFCFGIPLPFYTQQPDDRPPST